jgi:hypothetical protein
MRVLHQDAVRSSRLDHVRKSVVKEPRARPLEEDARRVRRSRAMSSRLMASNSSKGVRSACAQSDAKNAVACAHRGRRRRRQAQLAWRRSSSDSDT